MIFDMEIKPIRSKHDYLEALKKLELVFDAKRGTPEGDELEVLSILIDKYENDYFPIDLPDPIETIKFRMEQMDMKPKDLAEVLGFKSRVSEILNKKLKLSLEMIRKLNATLRIPTEVLVQEY